MSKTYIISQKKPEGFFIERISNAEALRSVRKPIPRPGAAMKDKRNDYARKPKHFKGWN